MCPGGQRQRSKAAFFVAGDDQDAEVGLSLAQETDEGHAICLAQREINQGDVWFGLAKRQFFEGFGGGGGRTAEGEARCFFYQSADDLPNQLVVVNEKDVDIFCFTAVASIIHQIAACPIRCRNVWLRQMGGVSTAIFGEVIDM